MGYDITAFKELSYFRMRMGGFRQLKEESGYDFFKILEIENADMGVSGNGETYYIDVELLIKAEKLLNEISRTKNEDSYTNYAKHDLGLFLFDCINYCQTKMKKFKCKSWGIHINFG